MNPSYRYRAKIIHVVDGDTFDAEVDLGFHVIARTRFRLKGVDTPEVRGDERPLGLISSYAVCFIFGIQKQLRPLAQKIEDEVGPAWLEEREELWSKIADIMRDDGKVIIESEKAGKYGRWLATVWCGEAFEINLNEWLVKNALAKEYLKD